MPQKTKVNVGDVYGRLTVVSRAPSKNGRTYWRCECECGKTKDVLGHNLITTTATSTKSCGCLAAELSKERKTHGRSYEPEYTSWQSMKNRCNNPLHDNYHLYGGRGITYDSRWEQFEEFYKDMGERPPGTTLDRIDSDANYCKENTRWATAEVQGNNKSTTRLVEYNGELRPFMDVVRESGIDKTTLRERIRYGMSMDEAVAKGHSSHGRKFLALGKEHTLPEWVEISGLPMATLRARIGMGWDMDRVVTEPAKGRKYTFNGETLLVSEWAKKTGLKECTINSRLRKSWPIEKVLAPL